MSSDVPLEGSLPDQSEIPAHTALLVRTISDYRTSEGAMRARTRESMRMGATDLQALRFLLKAQGEQRVVSSRDLGEHLGMTSASITAMLDRLTASGHLQRQQHPTDRRSISIVATPGSDEEVRATLGAMHQRLIAVARKLNADEAALVQSFLTDVTATINGVDPTTPAR